VLHIRVCKFETAPDQGQHKNIHGYWTVTTSKVNGVRISGYSFPVFLLLSSTAALKEKTLALLKVLKSQLCGTGERHFDTHSFDTVPKLARENSGQPARKKGAALFRDRKGPPSLRRLFPLAPKRRSVALIERVSPRCDAGRCNQKNDIRKA